MCQNFKKLPKIHLVPTESKRCQMSGIWHKQVPIQPSTAESIYSNVLVTFQTLYYYNSCKCQSTLILVIDYGSLLVIQLLPHSNLQDNTVFSVYNLGSREAEKPEIISEGDYKRSPRGFSKCKQSCYDCNNGYPRAREYRVR